MFNLCWWEWEELRDHLRQRPDIWRSETDEETVWTRSQGETPVMGLHAALRGAVTNHYRQYQLSAIPVGWQSESCTRYLAELVDRWSSFGTRMRTAQLLIEELACDEKKAMAAAIAIAGFEFNAPPPDPEKTTERIQVTFWGDNSNWYDRMKVPRGEVLRFESGGYFAMRRDFMGTGTAIRVMLPGEARNHYTLFEGHVRILRGNEPFKTRNEDREIAAESDLLPLDMSGFTCGCLSPDGKQLCSGEASCGCTCHTLETT